MIPTTLAAMLNAAASTPTDMVFSHVCGPWEDAPLASRVRCTLKINEILSVLGLGPFGPNEPAEPD